jgi:mannose-6-phosphate isomerase-like protein (cupin superfamily)
VIPAASNPAMPFEAGGSMAERRGSAADETGCGHGPGDPFRSRGIGGELMTEDSKRSGVRIYRAAEAPDLTQTTYGSRSDFGEYTELKEVALELAAAARTASRVLVNQTKDEGGFSLVYLYFKPNFPLFRHKHEHDCMYVIISGSAIMGNQTLRAGDCFFVPATAPYSYTAGSDGIEVLEIRHDVDPDWGFTTIFAPNPASRLEEARAAIERNAESWSKIETGPLLRANAAGI